MAATIGMAWAQFPVRQSRWEATVGIVSEGRVVESHDVTVPAAWDVEAAPHTVRRQIRTIINAYRFNHPKDETYQAAIFRLALRAL
jgi:hypothetical protein